VRWFEQVSRITTDSEGHRPEGGAS